MKHGRSQTLLLMTVGFLITSGVFGQSLGDLARRNRTRGQAPAAGKVYTNDDVKGLPENPPDMPEVKAPEGQAPGTPAQRAEGTAATPAAGGTGTTTGTARAAQAQPAEKNQADLEKEYREKFAKAREQLALEERQLDVMQRELNLMQTQFYSNPQDTLTQEYTRGNITKRTEEVEIQRTKVEKAKQAIADLEDELRQKGLPAGWAR